MDHAIPPYATRLRALHRALDDDFRAIVARVPLARSDRVLDVGCGDGYFTQILAERSGQVTGLDNSEAYLKVALADRRARNKSFISGDARALPFADGTFDVAWSGHSMQSYPDLPICLNEFRRILRPGGTLAVLETDNVHSVMLSWPPDLELAVRQAEHLEIGDEDSYVGTYFPRFAKRLFDESGFVDFDPQYRLVHRLGPASEALSEFVELYLIDLLHKTSDNLSDRMKGRLALLCDKCSDKFLPRQNSFFFGSMQVLMLAKAPGRAK
jgi:SAM-dependent methyltransferase